MTVIPETRGAH